MENILTVDAFTSFIKWLFEHNNNGATFRHKSAQLQSSAIGYFFRLF